MMSSQFPRRAAAAMFGILASCWTTHAAAFCSEPSAPFCASSFGAFSDQWDFDRCKSEMESYKDDVERFMQCNADEAEEAARKARDENEEAASEYSDAVASFNRRAGSY